MLKNVWQEFLTLIREEVGSRVVETWFKAISFERWDDENKIIFLNAPNRFVKDWVCKHYLSLFQLHFGRLLHTEAPQIIFVDEGGDKKEKNESSQVTVVPLGKAVTKNNIVFTGARKAIPQLNSAYRFDTFVVGPSNSLAYAAAHAVTEKPGHLYNPLFIYGGSGLGKTHLLHAIGNEIKDNHKRVSILYQTADRFVNEFISAIRFNKMHKFKTKYQLVDVLLIDDLQFISNKEQTQEAFFHIFNSLYDARKQIVFSSDIFPQDMNGIAERLRSRIIGGLITDIHRPSLETKVAILKKKAALNQEKLSDEVAHFIASHVVSNIRELEGALIRVLAFGSLTKQPVTLDLAERVLIRFVERKNTIIDFKLIITTVCKRFNFSFADIQSKNRSKDIAYARHIAMFLMKKLTDKSLRDIGSFLGRRDHSTVMHAIEKIETCLEEDTQLKQELSILEKQIMN